jgi:drug/metabolite transporter (DMT)-like permease
LEEAGTLSGMGYVEPEDREYMRLGRRKLGWGVLVFVVIGLFGMSMLWTSEEPERVLFALGGLGFLIVAGVLWRVRRTVTRALARADAEPTAE